MFVSTEIQKDSGFALQPWQHTCLHVENLGPAKYLNAWNFVISEHREKTNLLVMELCLFRVCSLAALHIGVQDQTSSHLGQVHAEAG